MLYAIENLLAPVLRAALPSTVQVVVGPPADPPARKLERVEISASGLEVKLDEADPLAPRGPAFMKRVHRWSADGTAPSFTLPPTITGEVFEVESPPGHPVQRGEDYEVDGTTLRFYRPPAAAVIAVVATLRMGAATGFQECRPCRAQLTLTAWAAELSRTDQLLDLALAAMWLRCVDLETLEAQNLTRGGVRLRLLKPALVLEGIERTRVLSTPRWIPRALARLRLHAELELSVAVGDPKLESRIEQIRYRDVSSEQ